MEMQITANSTTSTNNDLIKGKSTITDIGKEKDQKNFFSVKPTYSIWPL